MKKLSFVSVLLALCISLHAQLTFTTTQVTDTLHYYYQKVNHISGGKPFGKLAYLPGPSLNNLTHVGSRFECKDTVTVFGLECFTAFSSLRTSQASMDIFLYLCNLDANGLPILPEIDIVKLKINKDTNTIKVGGNFANNKSYKMTKDFAVLMRNGSTHSGDSCKLVRTTARTYTAWAATNGPTWRDKYSDGYGYVRFKDKFYTTTNFTMYPGGFGVGTDYEFLVAPRVSYNLTASHIMPTQVVNTETVCTWDPITFTNTSSFMYTNRMYNFLEFNGRWNSGHTSFFPTSAPSWGFPTDSAITWFFRDQDNGLNKPDPRNCLGRKGGNNTVSHFSDSTGCFVDNMFIARLQKMNIGSNERITSLEAFNLCLDFCDDDALGLEAPRLNSAIRVFPNPANEGKATISGLEGSNTIYVYDLLGQLVSEQSTGDAKTHIDISKQSAGTYVVRVVNQNNQTRVIKLLKQ